MSKSRAPLVLGLAAAGGVGYYFYSAGGDAKAAENKFESALRRPSSPSSSMRSLHRLGRIDIS